MKSTESVRVGPSIRRPRRNPRIIKAPFQRAAEAIGELSQNMRIIGMTKGQFSLLDLISAVLAQTGPAYLTVSTWTAGIRDAENARLMLDDGRLLGLRLLCDRSFPRRQPKYCRRIVEAFGPESIRCTNTHAKFALIRNGGWAVVIRSSMNLNRNPRFEQFDLDVDEELFEFFDDHVREMEWAMPEGFDVTVREVNQVFAGALGGGLSEDYADDLSETAGIDAVLLAAEKATREALA